MMLYLIETRYRNSATGSHLSLQRIHLRKLLKLLYSPANLRTAALRVDIRADLEKENQIDPDDGTGGDFFGPFWADARRHVAQLADLGAATSARVQSNKSRRRLYPLLESGFLTWWNEKRRWNNEPYEYMTDNVRTQYAIAALDCTIKIENLICVELGNGARRLIYPYFSEQPVLTEDAAREGLFLLGQGLPSYSIDELRILDVLRGMSFSTSDFPLRGDEEEIFMRNYRALKREWDRLRTEYP